MLNFIINGLSFFKDLIKICISYGCILFCSCLKSKCINEDTDDINVSSPTPLKKETRHPVLEAYEEHIINKIKSNE